MEKDTNPKRNLISEEQSISIEMLKIFYDRPTPLTDNSGNPFEAPPDGSLGLLALGHIGLIEWRKSREKYLKNRSALPDPKGTKQ
jgi:hypothetical protein